MLTRLEVDGFKNLLGFSVDLGPYTCIAGVNASGKSNVFDAIQFLSLLADHTFMDAALLVRSTAGRLSDPRTLFWDDGSGRPTRSLRIESPRVSWRLWCVHSITWFRPR
ncbi:AAA family ATPase [Aeromicrobium sp.]|uniref:AAA family ATPase n=1 Tax=Aeromicrobium sp. TaxID=1871063 RepID=UPI0034575506